MHAHLAGFIQPGAGAERAGHVTGSYAARLDIAGIAQTAAHALGRTCGTTRSEAAYLCQSDRTIEQRLVVADVVGQADRGRVGELADEIAPAQLGRVDLQLVGG